MSERAERKAWIAAATEAAEFALRLPEDDADWSLADRAELDRLMAAMEQAADRHDAARRHGG